MLGSKWRIIDEACHGPILTIASGLAPALLGGLGLWLLRAGRDDRQRLTAHLDDSAGIFELAGRLAQMAENTSAQGQLAEALQRQERELAKRLEDRLADLNRRIGDTPTRNQNPRHDDRPAERLAVIDAAKEHHRFVQPSGRPARHPVQ